MQIIFIDGNCELTTNLVTYFETRGYKIDAANDGVHGLNLALENHYDAIVMARTLPGMDGITICKRLREAGKKTPIMMLTSRDSLEDKISGFEAGVDDYVVKPFSVREVEARLLAMIRRARLREIDIPTPSDN